MGRRKCGRDESALGYSHPLDFSRYGRDREAQDEMTLIRLITVIIRLKLAEFKDVSRLGAPRKRTRREKERANEKGKKNPREPRGTFV